MTDAAAAMIYIAIGVAAWLRAPRDIRTRVFLAFSLVSAVTFGLPAYWWLSGTRDPTKVPVAASATFMCAVGMGGLLLLHFTQVFPRRRPWIRSSGIQMGVAYVLAPLTIAVLAGFAPRTIAELTTSYVLVLFVFGFPLLVLLAVIVPVAGIVSLLRSHRDVQQEGLAHLKRPIEWILLSQVAGGTLAIVFAPVLAVIAPNGRMQSILTVTIWAFGLLTPGAYAAAIWKYGVLALPPDSTSPADAATTS